MILILVQFFYLSFMKVFATPSIFRGMNTCKQRVLKFFSVLVRAFEGFKRLSILFQYVFSFFSKMEV